MDLMMKDMMKRHGTTVKVNKPQFPYHLIIRKIQSLRKMFFISVGYVKTFGLKRLYKYRRSTGGCNAFS